MKKSILLLGPVCVGKTTLSRAIAENTGLRLLPLDLLQWYYYAKMNMDLSLYSRLRESNNLEAFLFYLDNYKRKFIEAVLNEFDNCILDFGALHSFFVYQNNINWFVEKTKRTNHYLLLPEADYIKSLQTLNRRIELRYNHKDQMDFPKKVNEYYLSKMDSYLFNSKMIFQNAASDKEILNAILEDNVEMFNDQHSEDASANNGFIFRNQHDAKYDMKDTLTNVIM